MLFSSFRRPKTCLRSTVRKDRLNGLVLLKMYKNIKITQKEVIEELSKYRSRKLQLQCK